jgi:clan AA aspartic protease
MIGQVDQAGRALLAVQVRASPSAAAASLEVWIDTGFTGELVLPQRLIDQLQLPRSSSVDAILADGSQVELDTHTCYLDWFGQLRQLEVIANEGEFPLLGVGLLSAKELRVDYRNLSVSLLPVSKGV